MSNSRSGGAALATNTMTATNAAARTTDDRRPGTRGVLAPTTRPTDSLAAGTSKSAANRKMPGMAMRADDHELVLGSANRACSAITPRAIAPANVSGRLLSLPTTAAPYEPATNRGRTMGSSGPPLASRIPASAASIDPSIQLYRAIHTGGAPFSAARVGL